MSVTKEYVQMFRRKHFLADLQIEEIIDYYGGFDKYCWNKKVTQEYDILYFHEINNFHMWLTVQYNYKLGKIEVRLTKKLFL